MMNHLCDIEDRIPRQEEELRNDNEPCETAPIGCSSHRELGVVVVVSPQDFYYYDDPKQRDRLRALVGDMGVTLFAPLDLLVAPNETANTPPRCNAQSSGVVKVLTKQPQPPPSVYWSQEQRLSELQQSNLEEDDTSRFHHHSTLPPLFTSSEGSHTVATTVTTSSAGFDDDETELTDTLEPPPMQHHHSIATRVVEVHEDDDDDAWFCWIEPEPLLDLESCPRLLTDTTLQQITPHLPRSCQGHMLERCFCIGLHGDSLVTMLHQCQSFRYTLMIIQTTKGDILGGFATEHWNDRRHNVYFGNGHSFLFASQPDFIPGVDVIDDDPGATTNGDGLFVYPWSGVNDYCQICDPMQNRIAMGGDGDFGLIVRDNFAIGDSGRSRTYRNPPLVKGGRFDIAALEVYGIVPFSLSPPSRPSFVN